MWVDWILWAGLLISLVTDFRSRKILNVVTYPLILVGFLNHSINNGWNGFYFSGEGFLLGLGMLLIPFLLNGMGAGDVKLVAAVGAMKGAAFTFSAVLYIWIAGGVIACVLLLLKGKLMQTMRRIFLAIGLLQFSKDSLELLEQTAISGKFPYAAPIVIGTAIAYMLGGVSSL